MATPRYAFGTLRERYQTTSEERGMNARQKRNILLVAFMRSINK